MRNLPALRVSEGLTMLSTPRALVILGVILAGALAYTGFRTRTPEAAPRKSSFAPTAPRAVEPSVRHARREAVAPTAAAEESEAIAEKRAQMEAQFTDLKEEGRRMRQALLASDPRAAQAYQVIGRSPEYRLLIERRHALEATWPQASDAERPAILAEINSLREQGVAMVLTELARTSATPPPANVTTTQRTNGAAPANNPAPAQAPVIFQ